MTESTKNDGSSADDELERLRELILGAEQDRLHKLDWRIKDLEARTADVAEVLPGAMNRVIDDPATKHEIEQPIVDTIRSAIKRDTEAFAEALFPVLGPAIRRAVADALKSMAQRINVALENSFTIKGVRWRMEAARSGVPFGQIVLRHTMVYAVQEAFLIQRDSGLVLAGVRRDETLALDEDAVSAMLTAIQAFIQDSLGVPNDEPLRSAELGDRTVWVVNGPNALLACVITGSPPRGVRDELMDILETLHARFGNQFAERCDTLSDHPGVNALMQQTLREEVDHQAPPGNNQKYKFLWLGAGAALLVFLAWNFWNGYRNNQLEQQVASQFSNEPGYLLTTHELSGGELFLTGLRDPVAVSPESVLERVDGLDSVKITHTFRPFQSLENEISIRRLRTALDADSTVTLELSEGILQAGGKLTSDQYSALLAVPLTHPVIRSVDLEQSRLISKEAEELVRKELAVPDSISISASGDYLVLAGTTSAEWFGTVASNKETFGGWEVDVTPLRNSLEEQIEVLGKRINGSEVDFSSATEVAPASREVVASLSQELIQIQGLAAILDVSLVVRLEGFADGVGSEEQNQKVAMSRAAALQSELGSRGVNVTRFTLARGAWERGSTDGSKRKVVVHVRRDSVN